MNKLNNCYKYIFITILVLIVFPVLTVHAQEALQVSCTVSQDTAYYGDDITWTSTISGGTTPYTIDWSGTDGLSGSSDSVSKSYDTAGGKSAEVIVADSIGSVEIIDCPGVVILAPLEFSSCYSEEPNSHINYEVTWVAELSGGLGPYNMVWSGTDGISGSDKETAITYTTVGEKEASVSNISSADGQVLIGDWVCSPATTVYEDPEPLEASCSVNTDSIKKDDSATWNTLISGGTTPYTIDWSGTDGLSGSSDSVSKSYDTTGQKEASINVSSDDGQVLIGVSCGSLTVEEPIRKSSGGSRKKDETPEETIEEETIVEEDVAIEEVVSGEVSRSNSNTNTEEEANGGSNDVEEESGDTNETLNEEGVEEANQGLLAALGALQIDMSGP